MDFFRVQFGATIEAKPSRGLVQVEDLVQGTLRYSLGFNLAVSLGYLSQPQPAEDLRAEIRHEICESLSYQKNK